MHGQCVCLKRAVLNRLYDNDGLQGLKTQNYETFDENIFPDVPLEGRKGTQRTYIRKIRQICEQYADAFRTGKRKGRAALWRVGSWARRFCSTSWRSACWNRGYSVVVISAYKLTRKRCGAICSTATARNRCRIF